MPSPPRPLDGAVPGESTPNGTTKIPEPLGPDGGVLREKWYKALRVICMTNKEAGTRSGLAPPRADTQGEPLAPWWHTVLVLVPMAAGSIASVCQRGLPN